MVPGIIFLADKRTVEHGIFGECYITLLNDMYACKVKQVNAVILNPQADLLLDIPVLTQSYIIPIGGDLRIVDTSVETTVAVGEMFIHHGNAQNASLFVGNPYPQNPTSFVHFYCETVNPLSLGQSTVTLGIDKNHDCLLQLAGADEAISLHIGIFSSRKETQISLEPDRSYLFACVLTGSFEIEGRLLHQGDCLLLWDLQNAELESLEERSIILIIKC